MKTLILFILLTTACRLSSQNVASFFAQIENSQPSDSTYDQRIKEIWSEVTHPQKNTAPNAVHLRNQYLEELRKYYLANIGQTTGEKAELYSYFILLRDEEYLTVLDRFPKPSYSANLWISIYPIYKQAYLTSGKGTLEGFWEELSELSTKIVDPVIRDFVDHQFDLLIGEKAPPIKKTDIYGQPVVMQDKVVLIDFWATWCKPCLEELPTLKRIAEKYQGDSRFMLVSISRDDNETKLKDFVRTHQMHWRQIRDGRKSGAEIAYEYRVKGIPYYLLIDQNGLITYNSYLDNSMEVLENKLAELLP